MKGYLDSPDRPTVEQLQAKYAEAGFCWRLGRCVGPEVREKIRRDRQTMPYNQIVAKYHLPMDIIQAICRDVRFYAPRPIVCRTNPAVRFVSIQHAADSLGVTRNAVTVSIEKGQACCGYHLRFEDTPEESCPPMKRKKEKTVIFQGQSYPSISCLMQVIPCPPGRRPMAHFMWISRYVQREGQERTRQHRKFEETARRLMGLGNGEAA